MSVGENVKYKQGMSLSTEQSDRAGAAFGPVTRGVIRYVDGIRSTSGAGQKPLRSVLSSGTTGMPVRFERRTRLFMATETVPEPEAVSVDVPEDAEEENGKRSFLKLAGIAGAGVAASMLLPSKAEALVFGSTPASNVVGLKNASNARIDPATEGGNLAGIKTNTDPLVTREVPRRARSKSTTRRERRSIRHRTRVSCFCAAWSNLWNRRRRWTTRTGRGCRSMPERCRPSVP